MLYIARVLVLLGSFFAGVAQASEISGWVSHTLSRGDSYWRACHAEYVTPSEGYACYQRAVERAASERGITFVEAEKQLPQRLKAGDQIFLPIFGQSSAPSVVEPTRLAGVVIESGAVTSQHAVVASDMPEAREQEFTIPALHAAAFEKQEVIGVTPVVRAPSLILANPVNVATEELTVVPSPLLAQDPVTESAVSAENTDYTTLLHGLIMALLCGGLGGIIFGALKLSAIKEENAKLRTMTDTVTRDKSNAEQQLQDLKWLYELPKTKSFEVDGVTIEARVARASIQYVDGELVKTLWLQAPFPNISEEISETRFVERIRKLAEYFPDVLKLPTATPLQKIAA